MTGAGTSPGVQADPQPDAQPDNGQPDVQRILIDSRPGEAADPLAAAIEDTFREATRLGADLTQAATAVARVLREKLSDGTMLVMTEGTHVLSLHAMVSSRTGRPYVAGRFGPFTWLWTIDEARDHAQSTLTAAEAAVCDATVYGWLTEGPLGALPVIASEMVTELRAYRTTVNTGGEPEPEPAAAAADADADTAASEVRSDQPPSDSEGTGDHP